MDVIVGFILRHVVSAAVALPIAGALAVLATPERWRGAAKAVAFVFSSASLLATVAIFLKLGGTGEIEMMEVLPWIPSLGVFYRVGVDGVSALLMCLASLLALSAVVASWREVRVRQRLFYALVLVSEAGMLLAFSAVDVFLFFVAWTVAVSPISMLIGIWGDGERIRAALKFAMFAAVGCAAMAVSIAYAAQASSSFDLVEWFGHRFSPIEQYWLFAGFAVAFGVSVPIAGLHTWFGEATARAPTAGAILMAGVVMNMGAYGFFRIAMPLAPAAMARFAPVLLVLAVAGVLFGALLAMAQSDLRRLIAAASISQMGLVILGLASLQDYAAAGAVLLMAAHGIIVCGLFFTAGMLRSRRGSVEIGGMGGTIRSLPITSLLFIFMALALAGLPGLAGFSGQVPLLLGAFQSRTPYAAVAIGGSALLCICIVVAVARAFLGPLRDEEERRLPDAGARDIAGLLPIVALVLIIGIWPQVLVDRIWRPAQTFVKLSSRVEMIIPVETSSAGGER